MGPDFLCIGMPKAGTDWLYDQLDVHPEFWMPPIKELHFFDRMQPAELYERGHSSKKILKLLTFATSNRAQFRDRIETQRGRQWGSRDDEFLDRVQTMLDCGFSTKSYNELFLPKGNLLSGDITPAYCTLDEASIRHISGELGQRLKVILLIRNPVDRLWSQLSMHVRKRPEKASLLKNLAELKEYLKRPGVQARSFASRTYQRWSKIVDPVQIWVGSLDQLKDDAPTFRASVIEFLGADPMVYNGQREAGFNRKAQQQKFIMPDGYREFLQYYFADEVNKCAVLSRDLKQKRVM